MGGRALGNYQKNIPSQKKVTKKIVQSELSKRNMEQIGKKIGARPDPEKNFCSKIWPSLPLPHIKIYNGPSLRGLIYKHNHLTSSIGMLCDTALVSSNKFLSYY